jgi:hypothetical protein
MTSQITITPKHQKVLALAGSPAGCHSNLYIKEALELRTAGIIETRETFTTGGNRVLRHFQRTE